MESETMNGFDLVKAIKESGLTKRQFADKCEIQPETLARILNGTFPITENIKAVIKELVTEQ